MTGEPGTLETIVRHLALAVRPLRAAVSDVEAFQRFMYRLGWRVDSLPPDYVRLGTLVEETSSALATLDRSDGTDPAAVLALLTKARATYQAVSGLTQAPAGVDPAAFLAEVPRRMVDLLLVDYTAAALPSLYQAMKAVGVIGLEAHGRDGDRPPYACPRMHFERVRDLIDDPMSIPRFVYGWGEDDLDTVTLLANLRELLEHTHGLVSLGSAPADLVEGYLGFGAPRTALTLRVFQTVVADVPVEVAFVLLPLPAEGDHKPGLILQPVVPPAISAGHDLGNGLSLRVRPAADLSALFGIVLRPGEVSARYPLAPGTELPPTGFGVVVDYRPDSPALVLGSPAATRLTMQGVSVALDLDRGAAGLDVRLGLTLQDLTLVLGASDQDGFLTELVGDADVVVPIPLTLTWSSTTGIGFAGGAGLTLSRSTNLPVGPITISTLLLAVRTTIAAGHPPDLIVDIAASLSGKLGPVEFSAEDIGLRLTAVFADGNAGPFDIEAGFKPPTGVGLAIDAGVVTGGGFLAFDPEREEYAGGLEIQLGKIGLKAIGLLSTGPGDWSLVLLLYARIPPVQLGFGFTLEGIGGLIGVQRGVDLPQLVAGMKNGAFDDILFPADPVGDAPRILGRLRTLFPARAGSVTVGPMVDIHWGEPVILTARLAVLLQLDNALGGGAGQPALSRVVVVGQLRVAVGPTEEDPAAKVIELIIDVLGFWDLAGKRYGVLAALRDSSVAGIDLTGGLGVWGEYGDHPRLLVAAGGFNPRFRDVPALLSGVLDRLGASFSVGRFDLVLAGYFAVTPATVQAGMNLHASAEIGPVGIVGDIGFDVLIQRRPRTHFIADFHVVVAVTYHGHTLAGVKVTGTVEGPGRWHLVGKLTFSILWWDISKSFDESWGAPAPLVIEQVDVRALLAAELAKPANWSAQLPAGGEAMVTLAPRHGDPVTRAHPLGRFVFSQQVAPLGLTLDTFGDAAVAGPNRFDIESVTIGGRPLAEAAPGASNTPVREHFARAQFLEVPEEDRLTRPAFEEMDAGAAISSAGFEVSAHPVGAGIAYETKYLDLGTGLTRPEARAEVSASALEPGLVDSFGRYGAAGRAPQRTTEELSTVRLPLTVSAPPLAAADRRTLAEVALDGPPTSAEMIVEQRLRRPAAAGAQLVEAFEVTGA
jgi:hypothetical protein